MFQAHVQTAVAAPAPVSIKLKAKTTTPDFSAPGEVIRYPEPSAALRKQISFSDVFYEDKYARAVPLLRSIRKARKGKCSPAILFADARDAYFASLRAERELGETEAELPDHRKQPYPSVHLNLDGGTETSFPSEVIRFYDDRIKEARAAGESRSNILYLKHRKIERLERLKQVTEEFLDDQRNSGLYALRVEAGARNHVLFRLMYEACCTVKLKTRADCELASRFLCFMACSERAKPTLVSDLDAYQVASLSRRIANCLADKG